MAIILACDHGRMIDKEFIPWLTPIGAGVVCSGCDMLLTWEELAEYMRGEAKEEMG